MSAAAESITTEKTAALSRESAAIRWGTQRRLVAMDGAIGWYERGLYDGMIEGLAVACHIDGRTKEAEALKALYSKHSGEKS